MLLTITNEPDFGCDACEIFSFSFHGPKIGMRHCFTMSDYFEILGKLAVGKMANTGSAAVYDCG